MYTRWITVVVRAGKRFVHERAPEAAASVAFYAIFSLFPLLLILVAVGSGLLESAGAQDQVLDFVLRFFPVSRELIRANLVHVLDIRGAVGLIGLVGLLWSATSAFAVLSRNLNRAWTTAAPQNLFWSRLMALGVVGGLVGLLVLFILGRTALRLLAGFPVLELAGRIPTRALFDLLIFAVVTLLYLWVPRTKVPWWAAVPAGIGVAAAVEGTTAAFAFFLRSGLAKYNVVYGSLGALIALLSWVYMLAAIILLGAHLAAAIAGGRCGPPVRPRGVASGAAEANDE